jgi:hypothetical protein
MHCPLILEPRDDTVAMISPRYPFRIVYVFIKRRWYHEIIKRAAIMRYLLRKSRYIAIVPSHTAEVQV